MAPNVAERLVRTHGKHTHQLNWFLLGFVVVPQQRQVYVDMDLSDECPAVSSLPPF
jgi:hypothetical protein